jgi:hypothetical protein
MSSTNFRVRRSVLRQPLEEVMVTTARTAGDADVFRAVDAGRVDGNGAHATFAATATVFAAATKPPKRYWRNYPAGCSIASTLQRHGTATNPV